MASRHQIEFLCKPIVRCSCGWIYRIENPNQWGSRSALDNLLDNYNDHRKGMKITGNSGPDRDEA